MAGDNDGNLMGMNFTRMGWGWGCSPWGWGGDGVKADGMGWGRGNFCGDGVGMGLMSTAVSTAVSLFTHCQSCAPLG